MPRWRNWQTRWTQNPLAARSCGFNSHPRHLSVGRARLPKSIPIKRELKDKQNRVEQPVGVRFSPPALTITHQYASLKTERSHRGLRIRTHKRSGNMPTTEQAEVPQPFHESIVKAIQRCPKPPSDEILRLLKLIYGTRITEGHDQIIATIREFFNFPGGEQWHNGANTVIHSLLDQRQVASQRTEGNTNVALNKLQEQIELLLALLKDRQPDSTAWNEFVVESLQNVDKLVAQALGR